MKDKVVENGQLFQGSHDFKQEIHFIWEVCIISDIWEILKQSQISIPRPLPDAKTLAPHLLSVKYNGDGRGLGKHGHEDRTQEGAWKSKHNF